MRRTYMDWGRGVRLAYGRISGGCAFGASGSLCTSGLREARKAPRTAHHAPRKREAQAPKSAFSTTRMAAAEGSGSCGRRRWGSAAAAGAAACGTVRRRGCDRCRVDVWIDH